MFLCFFAQNQDNEASNGQKKDQTRETIFRKDGYPYRERGVYSKKIFKHSRKNSSQIS
tara:strand:- start:27181 stop:27354 length:174 start_codon:yes stop_codon:yes gene_type:complete